MSTTAQHGTYMVAESTYGQVPASPAFDTLLTTGVTLGLSKGLNVTETLRPDRQVKDARHGVRNVGGNINAEIHYGNIDKLLEAVLMGTWAADTPGVGTDQVKAGTTRRSFTVMRHFTDQSGGDNPYHIYKGVEFNTASVTVNAENLATCNFGVVGQDLDDPQAAEPAGSTYNASVTTAPVDGFTGAIKEGGVASAEISSIEFNLENGLTPRYVIGDAKTLRPNPRRSNLTGTVTAQFDNAALMQKFISETPSSIDFDLVDPAGNKYRFYLPNVKYNGGQPDVQGDDDIVLSMPFIALYDETETSQIVIERTPI